ncbi:MAG: protein kinase domain-containing protein [Ktedonobacteraceae bacterium]
MVIDSSQLPGQTLGTCAIQRLIGRGGMGAVYLAQQIRPRREVAVKVFMPALLLDSGQRAEFLARFRREADAIAALDHINIVPLYEYGEQNELAYLVMPYVTGGTLRDLLEKHGILPLNDVVSIIEQAAAALDYAHEQGIIHRDLKPGNILFHADGRILLADFGLAKIVNEAAESTSETPSGITSAGTIIGTPEYFSPEQSTGNLVDRRTDVYSLGIVLYQMLSGHVPFTGATPVAIAVKHTTAEPPSILHYNSAIPHGVEAVIMKAIAKKPDQRYNSAGELARALQAAIPDLPPSQLLTVRSRDITDHLTPVILASNDTVAEMPLVATNEAQTVQTPLTMQAPQTLQTPEPQKIAQPTLQRQAQPDMMPIFAQPRLKKHDTSHSKWLLLMSGMLVLILLIGGSLSYLHFTVGNGSAGTQGTTSATRPSATATTTVAPNIQPLISVGTLLYSATRPNCNAAQRNFWSKTSNAQFICNQSATELKNTASSYLAGLYLNTLPNGASIPNDYVLQVQMSQSQTSFSSYGVFFRNQPGSQQGTYSFMLDPGGYWKAYTYDNVTGAENTLYGHKATVPLNGFTTIDIVVHGATFMFYLNGKYQGMAKSPKYAVGSLGFAVDTGADVYIRNLAIYRLPAS